MIDVGLLAVPAQWIGVAAVRLGECSLLANIQYAKMIYAGNLDYLVFQEIPDRNTLLGAAFIIASGLNIFHSATKLTKHPGNDRKVIHKILENTTFGYFALYSHNPERHYLAS